MSLNFSSSILKDYVYQQKLDGSYVFDQKTSDLQLADKNITVNAIFQILHGNYANIINRNGIAFQNPDCNLILLDQALNKYSRDIYGELRLKARIEYNSSRLPEAQRKNLCKFNDYGIKIDSADPYIHRQLAVLFYWLSVLKPFSVEPNEQVMKQIGFAGKFHNEYMSYLLIQSTLRLFKHRLCIHESKEMFEPILKNV